MHSDVHIAGEGCSAAAPASMLVACFTVQLCLLLASSLQYYDDAAGILRMVILSAVQPHRLLAAPPQPLPQHPCAVEGSGDLEGSQHGMHYNMSLDDMRSQVAGEEDRCLGGRGG